MSSNGFFTNTGEDVLFQRLPAGSVDKAIPVAPTTTHADDNAAVHERSPSRDTTTTATTATTTKTETTTTTAHTMLPQGTRSTAAPEGASTLVPDVMFGGIDALFERLDAVLGDSLVVGNVSVNSFRTIEAERDRRGRGYRLFFLPDLAYVIITIPTGRHEQAHGDLFDFVNYAIKDMGVRNEWTNIRAERFDALDGASGEGDSAGGPRLRRDGSVWPTLVVEAGASQSMPSLRIKAQWWFAASNYHIKVVVLVKIFVAASTIQIEKWIAVVPGPQRHGVTTTRARRAAKQPVLEQQVLINWVGPSPLLQTSPRNRALTDFHVEGAPLVLRFEDLLERQPIPAAGEHDILITEADLQDLAKRVWERT